MECFMRQRFMIQCSMLYLFNFFKMSLCYVSSMYIKCLSFIDSVSQCFMSITDLFEGLIQAPV